MKRDCLAATPIIMIIVQTKLSAADWGKVGLSPDISAGTVQSCTCIINHNLMITKCYSWSHSAEEKMRLTSSMLLWLSHSSYKSYTSKQSNLSRPSNTMISEYSVRSGRDALCMFMISDTMVKTVIHLYMCPNPMISYIFTCVLYKFTSLQWDDFKGPSTLCTDLCIHLVAFSQFSVLTALHHTVSTGLDLLSLL